MSTCLTMSSNPLTISVSICSLLNTTDGGISGIRAVPSGGKLAIFEPYVFFNWLMTFCLAFIINFRDPFCLNQNSIQKKITKISCGYNDKTYSVNCDCNDSNSPLNICNFLFQLRPLLLCDNRTVTNNWPPIAHTSKICSSPGSIFVTTILDGIDEILFVFFHYFSKLAGISVT